MPPLKQPTPLEDRAMEVLVNFFSSFCKKYEKDLDKLQGGIPYIKNETLVPPKLAAEIYNRMLGEFPFWPRYRDLLVKITENLVMDQTLIGHYVHTLILSSLNQQYAARVRGISRLRLNDYRKLPYSLDTLGLENLTIFENQRKCTDSDLIIIGKNCPMLTQVDVSYSKAVTDLGLAALTLCLDMEFLSLVHCLNVSASSLNHFLSLNKSIRHLSAWPDDDYPGFDFSDVPDWEWDSDFSPHESLESFTIPQEGISDPDLVYVVSKFPNLTSIKLSENWEGGLDLSVIKSLRKLSKIEIRLFRGSDWARFESLLEYFGSQIEWLEVQYYTEDTTHQSLDSIFRLCKNLEVLKFHCAAGPHDPKLVVPPFEKLEEILLSFRYGTAVQFGKMSNLQSISAEPCAIISESELNSWMFDHTNFPNLKRIKMRRRWNPGSDELKDLRLLSKTSNLDLHISVCCDTCQIG